MSEKNSVPIVVAIIGGAALWYWWKSRVPSTAAPVTLDSAAAASAPATIVSGAINPAAIAALPPATGATTVSDPTVVALRGSATGPNSRHACALPLRWINTVDPPYYGYCVTQSQFDEWTQLAGGNASNATNAYVAQFAAAAGGG